MRMWRNWQTRRFQVPVGDHMGSSPFIRTNGTPKGVLFSLVRMKGKTKKPSVRASNGSCDALREVSACGVSEIPFIRTL